MSTFFYTSVGPEFFDKLLSDAFQFSYPDLVKNREGRLARDQWKRLLAFAIAPMTRTLPGCALLMGVYVFMARFISDGRWVQTIQIALLFAIAAGFVKLSVNVALFLGDLIRGRVAMVEGRLEPSWIIEGKKAVNHHETGSRTITKLRYAVGGIRFDVPEAAFRILTDNFEAGLPTVRVFYTPSSKRILSIETISVEELVLRPDQMKKKRKPTSIWKTKLEE